MRKITGLLFALVMLLAVVSVAAQEVTVEPTVEVTAEATPASTPAASMESQATMVTRVRFAHLSPDAPVLVVYADGRPTNVQLLQYPAISGWVEFAGAPELTLIPRGAAQSQALIGPFILQNSSWTTIAIVGSVAADTVEAVVFTQDISPIPDGCARVTVFHAIEGAGAVDVVDDQGNTLVSGLGFAGGSSTSGAATSSLNDCDEAADSTTRVSVNNVALQCTALAFSARAGETAVEATAEATSDADVTAASEPVRASTFTGRTTGSCGYSFNIPAGTLNLQVVPRGGTASPLLDLTGTQFSADTYYFLAVIGTPHNPQLFSFSFPESDVSGLFDADQTGGEESADPTPEVTPEATTNP